MIVRNGFVSNSSSSSYIVDHYIKLPSIPQDDDAFAQFFFGSSHPMCKYAKDGVECEYPLDVPSVILEVKRLLASGMHPAPAEGYAALVKRMHADLQDHLQRTRDFVHGIEQRREEERYDHIYTSQVAHLRDLEAHPFATRSVEDAIAWMHEHFPLSETYLIYDIIEVEEGYYESFQRRNRPTNGIVRGCDATFECLFQGIPDAQKEHITWCVESDQNHVDTYWLDVRENSDREDRIHADPEYAMYLRLQDKFTTMRRAQPAHTRILGRAFDDEVSNTDA